MGNAIKEDDIYIGSLLEAMTLRFAPAQKAPAPEQHHEYHGGIAELEELQKEFEIFKTGRPFERSIALLGAGGLMNARVRNRWHGLLKWLPDTQSTIPGLSGDAAIVKTILDNFASSSPKPIYFDNHDYGSGKPEVKIDLSSHPLFYMHEDYITISLPMRAGKKS